MKDALIFDIQPFSLHDGPGIRTLIFFKGCSLACKWCANPEGIEPVPEIKQNPLLCIGCGACEKKCPQHIHIIDSLPKAHEALINAGK